MRSSLVIAAMSLVVATPLTAQSKARPRVHRQPHRQVVQRATPRSAPHRRQAAPRREPQRRQAAPRREPQRRTTARARSQDDRYRRARARDRSYDRNRAWERDRTRYADRDGIWRRFRDRDRDRDDGRYRLARPFEHGRFRFLGPRYRYPVVRIEIGARRVWLGSGFSFEIAAWDWPYAQPWCWQCDQFAIYVDPYHPGWYLLWDLRLGRYVHVRYLGH
jgi:hypothetical protein